jgi:hypothetical protein
MKSKLWNLVTILVMTVAGHLLFGCKSLHKPATASFASVQIQGHTAGQIRAATAVVFQQDGYAAVDVRRPEMVFEKEGTRWDQIAYGSWVNEAPVWLRVKVSLVPLAGDSVRVQCQAYKVRNKGDPFVEDEVRINNTHSKPYQTLLDKVAGQLK